MRNFGLIGKSLSHSFSQQFFTTYFEKNNIEANYYNFELKSIEEVNSLFQQDLQGLNVTIPYKQEIIPFLDELSSEAQTIGAVNCVQLLNGKTIGHNTDAYGFHQSIKPFLTNQHERAMILGTGGASKAVEFVLKNLGIQPIFISRNPLNDNEFGYDEMNNHMLNACKLIVNTTPIGTFPAVDECVEIPFEFLTPNHLVVDLIYNPPKTLLLQKSEAAGAQILNGVSMLKQQALKAWEIWNS